MRICIICTLLFGPLFLRKQFLRSIHRLILRYINGKRRALAHFAFQSDMPMMQFYQTLNQRQAYTASFMSTFRLIKTLKYFFLFFRRNTDTRINHLQNKIIIFFIKTYGNALSFFRIFKSV